MRNHPTQRNHIVIGVFTRNVRNEITKEIELHEFQVEVDASAIAAHLGKKAVISKARKSKAIHGAVIVTDYRRIS